MQGIGFDKIITEGEDGNVFVKGIHRALGGINGCNLDSVTAKKQAVPSIAAAQVNKLLSLPHMLYYEFGKIRGGLWRMVIAVIVVPVHYVP